MFDKLQLQSKSLTQHQIEQLARLFPHVVTEVADGNGGVKKAIDFTLLKQELSDVLVDGEKERYQLTWPGKREAILTAHTRIDKTLRPVKADSVDWDTTKNIYIEGDNLEALKLLQASYMNKVKCIYIDPPYNTGNDFVYNDTFKQDAGEYQVQSGQISEFGEKFRPNLESNGRYHSDWLTMMYSRLKLARNLLREDGVIFISIDDNEMSNLQKVADEIFGEHNFVGNVIWQRAFSPKNDAKYFSASHDFILVYARNIECFNIGKLERTAEANNRYKNPDNDPRGVWASSDLTVKTISENYIYPIVTPNGNEVMPTQGRCWFTSRENMKKLYDENRLWFGSDGNNVPRLKRFLSEVQDGIVPTTLWFHEEVGHNQEGRQEVKKLFDDRGYFDGPKPVRLLSKILRIANCSKNDIILDFFSGSATTAHAVMQLNAEDGGNRQYIMVQLPEETADNSEACRAGYKNICEIGKERIRRAAKKIKEDMNADIDYGFRVFRVDSSNMKDVTVSPQEFAKGDLFELVHNMKPDRTGEDLLIQALLEWGLELSLPMKTVTIEGAPVHVVGDNLLVAYFARNLSESVIEKIAEMQPLRVMFPDSAFASDAAKLNVAELFKRKSAHTVIKVL